MQKHKCKLCSKSFCNGRALGGHMKSHLVSSHTPSRKKLSDSVYSSSSSSEGKTLVYGLRENPRKSFRVFSKEPESSIGYNSDTEPESLAPVRKRSRTAVYKNKKQKKSKKMLMSHISSAKPVSYVSDCSQEHDLAMCLMMLSRDSRKIDQLVKKQVLAAEETKLEKRQFSELRRCLIDLNLPPPQENDVVSVVSAI